MENERTVYETVIGARVNDVHWWRVKTTMQSAELPFTKDGFELFIALKKTSPRYFSQYHKIKGQISKVESSIGEGCTGEQFINLLEKLGITPNQSTISRWFKTAGGFKAKSFYAKQVLIPICAVALIYKSKVQNSQQLTDGLRNINQQLQQQSKDFKSKVKSTLKCFQLPEAS